MATVKTIEERTRSFIVHYNLLGIQNKLPERSELLKIMGIKSNSTLSEILKLRQNIQQGSWEKFRKHFGISENSVSRATEESETQKAPLSTERWVERLDKLIDNNTKLADSISNLTGFLNSVGISTTSPSSQDKGHNEDESEKVPLDKLKTRLKDKPGQKKGSVVVKSR